MKSPSFLTERLCVFTILFWSTPTKIDANRNNKVSFLVGIWRFRGLSLRFFKCLKHLGPPVALPRLCVLKYTASHFCGYKSLATAYEVMKRTLEVASHICKKASSAVLQSHCFRAYVSILEDQERCMLVFE